MSKYKLCYKAITIGLALYGVKCLILKGLDKLDERDVIKEQERMLKSAVLPIDKGFSEWVKSPKRTIEDVEKNLAKKLKKKLDEIDS